jgi:TRAP transporter TAXI family solute receptor
MTMITLAGTLAIVGAVSAAYYFAMRPVTLRIAVGPPNSEDVRVIQGLTQAFARQHNYVRLRPVPTEGAVASATAIANQTADLAVIRGDLEVPKNAQAVATLRKNVAVLWVPPPVKTPGKKAAPKITKIAQLAGRRIGVIGKTPANVNLLKVIVEQYGVDFSKLDIVQFSTTEAADAVKAHKADVFLAAGPVNSKITTEAVNATAREGTPTFLAIDSADAISQNHPVYDAAEIPAGTYGGSPPRPEEEVKTISFAHHIVARKGLSDTTVAAFARQLFAIRQAVMSEFPLAAKIETPDTDKDAVIPVHPGAAAYVDGEEKSFMDRYSDYIWWALMAMSALGSLGAWFASYLRKDERTTTTSLRGRLLDMLAAARQSGSLEELDRMQSEADDIMRNTLDCFERGGIEEGSLTAFNIALEQFHNAVADRKALLLTMPPDAPKSNVQLIASAS